MPPDTAGHPAARLPAVDGDGQLNAVIETTRGSRNKIKYDERRGLFVLAHVLPAGAVFPFDFGFVPSTLGGDGDPLDVLVLMDDAAFAGCVVPARLVGVLEAEQREDGDAGGDAERNDRLLAVAEGSHLHRGVRALDDLGDPLLHEIEHFFASYNAARGRRFTPLGRGGPDRARALVAEGERRHCERAGGR
jgi:inorganic pyrophosphatase